MTSVEVGMENEESVVSPMKEIVKKAEVSPKKRKLEEFAEMEGVEATKVRPEETAEKNKTAEDTTEKETTEEEVFKKAEVSPKKRKLEDGAEMEGIEATKARPEETAQKKETAEGTTEKETTEEEVVEKADEVPPKKRKLEDGAESEDVEATKARPEETKEKIETTDETAEKMGTTDETTEKTETTTEESTEKNETTEKSEETPGVGNQVKGSGAVAEGEGPVDASIDSFRPKFVKRFIEYLMPYKGIDAAAVERFLFSSAKNNAEQYLTIVYTALYKIRFVDHFAGTLAGDLKQVDFASGVTSSWVDKIAEQVARELSGTPKELDLMSL